MFKVINIMTGVTVAAYDGISQSVAINMAKILNDKVPKDDMAPPFTELYVAIDTSKEDRSTV